MSHTTSGEWKSFERRMRRRRAQRLLLRAEIAAEAGCADDARACLAEVRRIAPGLAETAGVEARLIHPPAQAAAARTRWVGVAVALAVSAVAIWSARSYATTPPQNIRAQQVGPAPTLAADISFAAPPPDVRTPRTTDRAVEATAGRIPAPPPVATGAPDRSAGTVRSAVDRVSERVLAPPLPPPIPIPDPPSAGSGMTIPAAGDIAAVAAAVDALPVVALPAAGAPSTLAPPASSLSAPRTAETAVRGVLARYAAAYDALDADAATRVWPHGDRTALARAFDALASQHVALGDCRVDVSGATALAVCAGSATWVPKAGDGTLRAELRRYTFDLARAGENWQILDARVQNR
jgi:hypothetical protein